MRSTFQVLTESIGIVYGIFVSYTHKKKTKKEEERNRVSNGKNRTSDEIIKAMFSLSGLNDVFWGVYCIYNRCKTSKYTNNFSPIHDMLRRQYLII